jgi:uncharacterized membrane protein YesL
MKYLNPFYLLGIAIGCIVFGIFGGMTKMMEIFMGE